MATPLNLIRGRALFVFMFCFCLAKFHCKSWNHKFNGNRMLRETQVPCAGIFFRFSQTNPCTEERCRRQCEEEEAVYTTKPSLCLPPGEIEGLDENDERVLLGMFTADESDSDDEPVSGEDSNAGESDEEGSSGSDVGQVHRVVSAHVQGLAVGDGSSHDPENNNGNANAQNSQPYVHKICCCPEDDYDDDDDYSGSDDDDNDHDK